MKFKEKPRKSSLSRAGTFLGLAGIFVFLGIQIAEMNFVGKYTTKENYISDLGVNSSSASFVFNVSMITSGVLIILCARKLMRQKYQKRFTTPLFLYGIGTFGVGLFNSQNIGVIHILSAGLLFLTGPIAAWQSRKYSTGSVRRISAVLAITSLVFLVIFFTRQNDYNVGGIERLVVYPITMWLIIFVFYLNGTKNPTENRNN